MKKQALLIGLNDYETLPQLQFARQDAEAVAESLKQNYGFTDDEITLLTDASEGAFNPSNKNYILEQIDKLANQDLDLFVFGFWGHGVYRNDLRYFCPQDVKINTVEDQGISYDQLLQYIYKIKSKNSWLILDCCHSPIDMRNAARDVFFTKKKPIPEFQSNVVILNSCGERQRSYVLDEKQHSIFTFYLLEAMNQRFKLVSEIISYLSPKVSRTAFELGKEQMPFCYLEGEIVLPAQRESTPLLTGDVFIAYRHCDADLVAPIEEELKRRGISYFIDRIGINYGMDYAATMAQAIKACKVLLFVWTKDAKDSIDIQAEIALAFNLKKIVLPYKIGSFDAIEHEYLYYQLATRSRYEVPCQTPESITDVVDRIEQILTEKN